MKTVTLVSILMMFSGLAQAQVLLSPSGFQSAGVLPKGIRNVTLSGFYTEIYDKMDDSGIASGVAAGFNKSVKWRDVIDGMSVKTLEDRTSKGLLLAVLGDSDVDASQEVGQTYGAANVGISVQAPVFAYGLTDKWTIGFAIPVVTQDVKTTHGFVANAATNELLNKMTEDNRGTEAQKIRDKFQDPLQDKLTEYGYARIANKKTTEIGDIRMQNRIQLQKTKQVEMLLIQSTVIPTGRQKNINDLTDIGTGQGQWDLGIGSVVDFKATSKLTFTGYLSYTAQLPLNEKFGADVQAMRVPERGEAVTPDIDPRVSRDVGDTVAASAGVAYSFYKGWTASTAYNVQNKYADKLSGNLYEQDRYRYLEEGTEMALNSYVVGLEYSTLPLFLEKRFKVPLKAQLTFAKTIYGKNTYDDDIFGFNMGMFF